jgi:hypothetical protein
MANFNLNDYETVEERLRRFWAMEEHSDARIETINHTTPQDRAASTWVVETRIFLDQEDHRYNLPKATGWAFEIDGQGMANKTSALENCETSSIGRALANMNLSGNKRVTREEMAKVQRGATPLGRDWLVEAETLSKDIDGLRLLYSEAKTAKAPAGTLEKIKEMASELTGTPNSSNLNS